MKYQTAAIVIGGGLNGLGIIRALGGKNIALVKIDKSIYRPGMLSRYGKCSQFNSMTGLAFINELVSLLQTFDRSPVLFVTEEEPLRSISQYRDKLAGLCHILLPEQSTLNSLMSKDGIDQLAKQYSLLKPETIHIRNTEDIKKLHNLKYPCILKPGIKNSLYGKQFKKGYKVSSEKEAISLINEILPVLPDLVIQEWIEGNDTDIYFVIVFISKSGVLLTSFVGQKLRVWPVPVGGTASCKPACEHEKKLTEITVDFFHKAGFVGLGAIEYKLDQRDDRFYMIEPTVSRTDFQHEVSIFNGINMPYIIYCYHCNLPISQERTSTKQYAWIHPVTERWSKQKTKISEQSLYAGMSKKSVLFRWNDMNPWLHTIKNHIIKRLIRLKKRIVSS